jgi:hypothetical protein
MSRGWALAAAVFVLSGLPAAASAEIVVSPLTIEIPAAPGDVQTGAFVVRNAGTEAEEVSVSAFGYTLDASGGLLLDPVVRSLVPSLSFAPTAFTVQPGQETRVEFTFAAPMEAGDHWAVFFVDGSHVTPIGSTTGDVVTSIGVKIRYGVKVIQRDPAAVRDGAVLSMQLAATEPPSVAVEFANLGTSVLRKASGWLEFRDVTGAVVASAVLDEFTTLPGGVRDLLVKIPDEVLAVRGTYLALCVVDFGGERLVAGELQFAVE